VGLARVAARGREKFRVLQLGAAHKVEESRQSGSGEGGGQLELLLGAQGLLLQLPNTSHAGGQTGHTGPSGQSQGSASHSAGVQVGKRLQQAPHIAGTGSIHHK